MARLALRIKPCFPGRSVEAILNQTRKEVDTLWWGSRPGGRGAGRGMATPTAAAAIAAAVAALGVPAAGAPRPPRPPPDAPRLA